MGGAHHKAHIIIHGPGHDGTVRGLEEGITTFGRLPSNDVILLGDLVSRHHARITWFEGRATLQDLGSHNGSFVNAERVTTRVLKTGDKARVGNFQLLYLDGPPPLGHLEHTTASETGGPRLGVPPAATAQAVPAGSTSVLLEELQAARAGKDPDTRALRFVLRAADALATAKDLSAYMDEMLGLAIEQTGAQLGVYLEHIGDAPQVLVARTPDGPVNNPHVSMSVVRWVIGKSFPVKSANLGDDVRFADSPSRVAGALAVLCVPVGKGDVAGGAIYLSRATPAFDDTDLDSLGAVAHLVSGGLSRWSRGATSGAPELGRLFTEGAASQVQARLSDASGGLIAVDGAVLRAGLYGAGIAASNSRRPAAHTHFYDAWCEAALSVLGPFGAETRFGPGAGLTAVFGPGEQRPGPRAVQAALRLRESADALIGRHPEVAGVRLRSGIDQSRLLVGPVGGPNHTTWLSVGDAVEIAGRLETAAPAGAILVTAAVHRALDGRVRARPRGEQRVRGRPDPLVLFEILAPSDT